MVTYESPPSQISFSARLRERARSAESWLCVGIDPDLDSLPAHLPRTVDGVVEFSRAVIESTAHVAACFKVNFAFFEVLGRDGWAALETVRKSVPREVPVIADAKRGDIGNTDRAYAKSILEILDFDAVTVSPYLGWDSVEPFLAYPDKAAFVLCKTSNPGARDLQDLDVHGAPLYMHVARAMLGLEGVAGDVGLVVGATYPGALHRVRSLSEETVLLVPGVGAQGAEASDAVEAGGNAHGENALIAVSRQILQASPGTDFAHAAGGVARRVAHETFPG